MVHLTQIVESAVTQLHLCEKCAAEKGLESTPEPVSVPLTDFLAQRIATRRIVIGSAVLTGHTVHTGGGAFDAGWTGYAPLSTGAPLGQSFFNIGVQFAGASSIATATGLSWAREPVH